MMVGAVIVSACLLVLGFTREIVGGFMGAEAGSDAARRVTVVLAVAAIYAVDFAINMSKFEDEINPLFVKGGLGANCVVVF